MGCKRQLCLMEIFFKIWHNTNGWFQTQGTSFWGNFRFFKKKPNNLVKCQKWNRSLEIVGGSRDHIGQNCRFKAKNRKKFRPIFRNLIILNWPVFFENFLKRATLRGGSLLINLGTFYIKISKCKIPWMFSLCSKFFLWNFWVFMLIFRFNRGNPNHQG